MDKSQLYYKTANAAKTVLILTSFRIIVQFATQLILVRLLTPQIFGIFAFTQMTVYTIGLISNLNGNKLIIQQKEVPNKIVDVAFTLDALLGIFVTTILLFLADYVTGLVGKQEITLYVKLLCPILVLNSLLLTPKSLYEKVLNFKQSTTPAIFGALANSISSIVLVYLNFDIYALIYGLMIGRFVEVILLWSMLSYKPKLRLDRAVIKDILKYGLPITFSAIIAFLYWNIDDFMVGKILGNEQLGYYWVAFKFPHYCLVIQTTLSGVLFPSFSRIDDDEKLKKGFETVTKLSAIYLLIPCIISLVFGEQIIKYVFGQRWIPATLPFQIFMVLVALRGIIAPWLDVYLSRGKSIAILMNTINLIGITLLGYFLTVWYGISGMAIAVLICILLSIPLIKWVMSSIITYSYHRIILKPLLVSIFILSIGFVIKNNIPSSFLSVILSSVFLFIFYIFILTLWEKKLFLLGYELFTGIGK